MSEHEALDLPGPGVVSTAELAALLDVTPRRIRQLAEAGVLVPVDRNAFELVASIRAYIGFLQEDRRPSATAGAKVAEARAEEIEQRIEAKRRELIPREDHRGIIRTIAGFVDAEVAVVADRLPAVIRETARAEIAAARSRIAAAAERAATAFDR